MLIKLSTPDGLVISVEDAKVRLRIDDDDADDDLERMIRAATARYETRTLRTMLPTQFEWRAPDWSCIALPAVPIRGDLDGVVYLDAAGVEQTISPTDWMLDVVPDRLGIVTFTDSFARPALSSSAFPVRVRFTAGYDDPDDPADDPVTAQNPMDVHAVLMLAGHWYLNRETATDGQMTSAPGGFDDLVNERRIYR